MAEFTDFMENKIIDHMLRAQAYTVATQVWVGLYTTTTNDAGEGTEVTGGAYTRKLAGLNAATGGASSNAADITFPTATASWGTITHVALLDAESAGNMLMHSPLDATKAVGSGDTFKINAGDLDVTVE